MWESNYYVSCRRLCRIFIVIYMNLVHYNDVVAFFFFLHLSSLIFCVRCAQNGWPFFILHFTFSDGKLWRNSVTKTTCDGYPSQFSVTNCDGIGKLRHNLWRKLTDSVTILWRTSPIPSQKPSPWAIPPPEFVTEFPSQFPSQNFLWRKTPSQIPSQIFCDGKISVTIFPSQKFVTEFFPSQFPSQIVTDPSQNKLWRSKFWRSDFRHNFRQKMNFSVTIPENFRHNFRHN